MNVSQLINEILSEWAYRVDDGMPNPKNPTHIKELGIVLSEMGLSHIKNTLIENLLTEKGKTPEKHVVEADGTFKNPILNKSVKYKNAKGEDADGLVGNLLRLPAEHPGRKAAERLLPPEGSDERDALNKDLGGQNQPGGAEKPKDDKGGKEDGGAPQEDPIQKAAVMFDPKTDPAMAQRLDKEKEVQAQLAKDAEEKNKEAEKNVESEKKDDGFNPIPSVDVQKEMPQADTDTFGGESDIPDGIDEKDLNKFNTDIRKVAEKVKEAKAKGEKIDINLCQVTVPGTNLYCDDNLGIKRKDMPQFKGKPVPGSRAEKMPLNKDGEVDTEPVFREMLKEKGIKTTQTEVAADQLKATQSELGGDKVIGMMGALEENPQHPSITAPIYVSRDGYVIDGHHRWAAIVAYNAAHPDAQIPMKVEAIDMDIKDAIPMCNQFAEDMGIAAKKQGETTGNVEQQPKKQELKPNETNPESNVKTFKGESSGKEIKTVELEGGGFLFGTQHGDTKMADDIINQVKATIPKERWKDVVFVGEGGATGNSGELEFHDEMKYSAPKFKEMGASIDTWDGDDMDVHNNESKLYKKQKEKTGLNDNQILAGNWASMVGQGEGQGLDPNDPENNMKAEDYLDDEGKQFLQDAAKEAGLPPIENFDNPTGEKPSEENGWKGTGDRGTLYRLAFPDDNGDKPTKINDIQVAFNEARDENLIEKNKELTAQGKIPVIMAGESHADLVDDIMKGKTEESSKKEETYQMKEELFPMVDKMINQLIEGFIDEVGPKKQDDPDVTYIPGPGQKPRTIKYSSAIKYDQNHPAYLAAMKLKGDKSKTKDTAPAGAGLFKDKDYQDSRMGGTTQTSKKQTKKEPEQSKKSRVVDSFDAKQIKEIENEFVTIRQSTSDEMKQFNQKNYSSQTMPAGYTDEEYYNPKRNSSTQVRKKPYLFDESTKARLKAAGFPEKYIKFLERCINTKVVKKKPPVTELIDVGGAGQIQSQFGEVMAMAFMSIRDPQERAKMAEILKGEIEKSSAEFGGKKASPIATKEWIDASLSHAESFDASMDEKYGKGQWRFEGAAWDIKSDIEALGLDYKNKGFSTDVMLRVQPLKNGKPNGPARAQRCSLKKDENIMFFNGSVGEVENFILNYTSEDSRKKIKMYEALLSKANSKNPEEKTKAIEAIKRLTGENSAKAAIDKLKIGVKELRDEAYNNAPDEVKDVVNRTRSFMNDQLNSAVKLAQYSSVPMKPKELENAINSEFDDSGDREFAMMAYKFAQSCAKQNGEVTADCLRDKLKAAGEEAGTDRVSKLCVFVARTAKAAGYDVEDQLKAHYNIGKNLGKDLMKIIPKSKEMLGGVMQKLAEAFPMKVCMDGEEFMLIDGIKVTSNTLNTVFGVNNYDELNQGLDVIETPNGETILVYKVKGGNKQIPIGFVRGRQKGLGYESSVGFEIQCSDDFAYACSVANKENGDTSGGNEGAIKRIGSRISKRSKK
jgi:hypothetical protein